MAFTYVPPPENRSGENIGRGILQAGASIGDALAEMGRNQKELKGYKTLLEAYAEDPDNGINKDQIDKMSLPQAKSAILASEVRKNRATQMRQNTAFSGFLDDVGRGTAPRTSVTVPPMGKTYSSMMDTSGPGPVTASPGMSLRDAIVQAARNNPAILQTPIGGKIFGEALRGALTTPKQPPQLLDVGGNKVLFDSSTGKFIQPRGAGTMRTPATNPPKTSPDGKFYWDYNAGTWKPISGSNKPSFKDILNQNGADAGGQEEGAGTGKEAMGGYEIGATYSGMKYLGGDPNDETNWSK